MNSKKLFHLTIILGIPALLVTVAYLIFMSAGNLAGATQMVMQYIIMGLIVPPAVPAVIFMFALLAADRREAEAYRIEGLKYNL